MAAELEQAIDGFERHRDPAALRHGKKVIAALLNHPGWAAQPASSRAYQLHIGGGLALNLFKIERGDGNLNDALSLSTAGLSIAQNEPFHGSKEMTGDLLNNLGVVKRNIAQRDDDGEMLRDAVNTLRRAVAIGSPDDAVVYAEHMSNLGAALIAMFHKSGDLTDLTEAIAAFRLAFSLSNRAELANHLGACFDLRYRILGNRSDLEAAIALTRSALAAIPAGQPARAGILNNLAIYLGARLQIDGNLPDAREAVLAATEAVEGTHRDSPLLASRLAVLGNLHAVIFQRTGAPQESDAAISCLREALAHSHGDIEEIVRIKVNLSLALASADQTRSVGEFSLQACQLAREALNETAVGTPNYLLVVNALSEGLRARARFTGEAGLFLEAADLVREGLSSALPFVTSRTKISLNLAHTLLDAFGQNRNPALLEEARVTGRNAIAGLMSSALRAAMPAEDIDHSTRLATRLALDLISTGDLAGAAAFFEQARSVRLSADAVAASRMPTFADPADRTAFHTAIAALRQHRATLDRMAGDPDRDQQAFTVEIQEVERLTSLIDELNQKDESAVFRPGSEDLVEQAAVLAGALAYVYATPAQAGLLMVAGGKYHHLALAGLQESVLRLRNCDHCAPVDLHAAIDAGLINREVVGWLPAYALHASEVSTASWREALWRETITRTVEWLDTAFGAPVAAFLGERDVKSITFLPIGELGLLPLHAAGAAGVPLAATIMVRYAPSASLLAMAFKRPEADDGARLVVADVDGDLPYAWLEALAVRGSPDFLAGSDVSRDVLVSGLLSCGYSHLAVHAVFDTRFPLESAIDTAAGNDGRSGIRLADILSGEVRLKPGATVVASACETGLYDVVRIPSEQIGFAGALLAGGAKRVVATLWPVADLSSALIMQRAAAMFDKADASMAQCILDACIWLRSASGRDIKVALADIQALVPAGDRRFDRALSGVRRFAGKLKDDDVPFSHPAYWAPFFVMGA